MIDVRNGDGIVAKNPKVGAVCENGEDLEREQDGHQFELIDEVFLVVPRTVKILFAMDDTPTLQRSVSCGGTLM
jgi:hypothetical protein